MCYRLFLNHKIGWDKLFLALKQLVFTAETSCSKCDDDVGTTFVE